MVKMPDRDEKPADENLPEVVINPTHPSQQTAAFFDPTPEVVSPDDAANYTYFTAGDKYPAQYDDTPKLPYDPNDPQYQNGQPWPVSALSPATAMPWESLPPADEANINNAGAGGKDQEKRICGLRRRTFIIVVVIALVIVIAAAVGGGVGATRARADSGTSSAAESGVASSRSANTNPTTSPPTSTTSQTSTSSTTSSILPTKTIEFLNNQTDALGQGFQGYEQQEYLGRATDVIRKEGYHDLPFTCLSYVWLPNGTDCCVTFCANKTTAAGWRCDLRYREKTEDGTGFKGINIWCDRANAELYKDKCSE